MRRAGLELYKFSTPIGSATAAAQSGFESYTKANQFAFSRHEKIAIRRFYSVRRAGLEPA